MTDTTTRHFVSKYGGPLALWVEQPGGGCGTHRWAIAFREDLDRIHPVLWPTLLAQHELVDDPTGPDNNPEGIEWQDAGSDAR